MHPSMKLSLLTVTQCSITAGRRFSEVELKVLLTHVSNIFCYLHVTPTDSYYSAVICMFLLR